MDVANDPGMLGVLRLRETWSSARYGRPRHDPAAFHNDRLVLHALGLGLEQTLQHVARHALSFEEFERWIIATAGAPTALQVARINAAGAEHDYPEEIRRRLADIAAEPPVLSAADLAFFDEHGYVVVSDAVPPDVHDAAVAAIFFHLDATADDPESWYQRRANGIMVQYFQHPAFAAIRNSRRIHKAFAQLWNTADLWVSTDRVGFNVPERPGWPFPGPDLHWDSSIAPPVPFGVGGILYLTDTEAEQGAFTCVPGFHRRLGAWLAGLPAGADPRAQDLHGLGSRPIPGRAGDLIIWHDALPHGSRPNRARRPRIVQYVTMYPARVEHQPTWL
jgi:ectoine hydroxylase-related dioxygenase (phytanoyl-CoA dioxygenase family)